MGMGYVMDEHVELFFAKLSELVELVDVDDPEVQAKYAEPHIGGIVAGRSYWETRDQTEALLEKSANPKRTMIQRVKSHIDSRSPKRTMIQRVKSHIDSRSR